MAKKCVLCNEKIKEEFDRLKGTILKSSDENKKSYFIYVCSDCQKKENWFEKAKVRGA
ncbi:MAG: hypothetical protein AABW90_02750 [Nanoarchaeota archaeon]